MTLTILSTFFLFMHVIVIGANILPVLIKMAKIMKAKDQLLVIVSLALSNLSVLHV
jgi:hypothetical protein